MNAVIVGHGPGLWQKGKGEFIDNFDVVIRIADFFWQDKESYGSKVDYCMFTYPASQDIPLLSNPPESWTKTHGTDPIKPKEIWIAHNMSTAGSLMVGPGGDNLKAKYKEYNPRVFYNLIYYWNFNYQKYKPRYQRFSTGITTTIVAAYHLKPEKLSLIGFDSLRAGINEGYCAGKRIANNDAIMQNCFIDHDLGAESQLMYDIANVYQINMEYI